MLFHFDHDVVNVEEFAFDGVVLERHDVEKFYESMVVLDHLRQGSLNDRLALLKVAEGSAVVSKRERKRTAREGMREREHERS